MRSTLFLLFAFAGSSLSNVAPTFKWLPQGSENGVHQLLIHFNDGDHDDIATLKQHIPIPSLSKELINPCIFRGSFLFDKEVIVTLTGCPNQDSFDIQFRSNRVAEYMFEVRNGSVKPLQSVYKNRDFVHDIALKPPKEAIVKTEAPIVEPKSYKMTVSMNIDQSFKERFPDVVGTIQNVVAHAEAMYLWPTLDTPLYWNTIIENEIPDYIEATGELLSYVGKYNSGNANTHVYLCSQGDASGTVGIAWVGTLCSSTDYRTGIVEYFYSDMQTSEVLAHEVGHNTGMNHDFDGSPGNDRYDSQGNSCSNIGGVMDYYNKVTRWSTCSNEDFRGSSHGCLG